MVAAFNYSSAIVAPADTGRIHRRAVRPMPPAPLADAAASSSWLAAVGDEQLGAHDYRPRWRKWVGLLRSRSSSAAFQNRTHSACSHTSWPLPRCGSRSPSLGPPHCAHVLSGWADSPPPLPDKSATSATSATSAALPGFFFFGRGNPSATRSATL